MPCLHCGALIGGSSARFYCSYECSIQAQAKQPIVSCAECSVAMRAHLDGKGNPKRWCSKECRHKTTVRRKLERADGVAARRAAREQLRVPILPAQLARLCGCGAVMEKRRRLCYSCRDQRRQRDGEAYRKKNRDKVLAAKKAYRKKNRDKVLAAKKAYREKNRDKIAASNKAYRERKSRIDRAQRMTA